MVSISGYLSSDLSASEMPVNGCQSGFPLLSVRLGREVSTSVCGISAVRTAN